MKHLIQKAFCLSVLVILATSFYDFGPLWFSICFILPFSLFSGYSILRHKGDFSTQKNHDKNSSSFSTSKFNLVGSGCNTIYQRNNWRGY